MEGLDEWLPSAVLIERAKRPAFRPADTETGLQAAQASLLDDSSLCAPASSKSLRSA